MQHIAIMKKSWGLTEKVLSGEKTIESRWYQNRFVPWDKIKPGETIYFKDAGGPVVVRAEVSKVEQFADLDPLKVEKILKEHHQAIGIRNEDLGMYIRQFKEKKYCILAYLKNPMRVDPFHVNKKGFGSASAWLCVNDAAQLRMGA